MNSEEAIDIIKRMNKGVPTAIQTEALEVAYKALSKQTPKEPSFEGDGYDNEGNIIFDTWICPNCESRYEVDYDDYHYCPNCGQAIG